MKKTLFSAIALLCSVAALAQTPTADVRRADKAAAKVRQHDATIKQHDDDDDRTDGRAGTPANHGQTVKAVAQGTTLTGADKGAAVSAVASDGRSTTHAIRSARGGEHGHLGGRPAGAGHQAGGHSAAGSHRGGH